MFNERYKLLHICSVQTEPGEKDGSTSESSLESSSGYGSQTIIPVDDAAAVAATAAAAAAAAGHNEGMITFAWQSVVVLWHGTEFCLLCATNRSSNVIQSVTFWCLLRNKSYPRAVRLLLEGT
jgi:hypothetical protein